MEGNGRMGMDKRKYMIMKICIFLIVFLAALVALFPFYWMFVTAVKPVGGDFRISAQAVARRIHMEQFCHGAVQSGLWPVL